MAWKCRSLNANWVPVKLVSSADFTTRLTYVLYSQLTVRYATGNSFPAEIGSWTIFTPTTDDWVELGGGIYKLLLPASAFPGTELYQGVYYVQRTSGSPLSLGFDGSWECHAPHAVNAINLIKLQTEKLLFDGDNFVKSVQQGAVDILQAGADKVWQTTERTLTGFDTLVVSIWSYVARKLTSRNIAEGEDIAREQTITGNLAAGILQNLVTVSSIAEQKIKRGDVKSFTFNLGTQWNLTDKKPYFCVKVSPTDPNASAKVNRVCTITDPVNGVCTITLTAEETAVIGSYSAEIEVRDADDTNPRTALQFTLTIQQDVRQ
ncbi:MAG: BppU family phage baseplate upper protein [Candidatus Eisenbacteria bacterium]|nr:BppU family phage baseplate upper protein [Candidatus Eisenbacteria bacterium]